jgi:hypothetical protein
VFSPNQQFVSVPPIAAPSRPASAPLSPADDTQEWQFPRNMYNNGMRGASASRGMLGY